MCEAIEQLMQMREANGFKNGEVVGFKSGEINGILETMKEFGSSKDHAVEKLLLRYPDSEDLILQLAERIFTAD